MIPPENDPPYGAFERIDEYKAVLDNLAQYNSRRLTTNAVFVGFNTVCLTALGALFVATNVGSWRLVLEVGITTVVITPVNLLWRSVLKHYIEGLELRYGYLQSIEQEFRTRRADPSIGVISLLHKPRGTGYHHRHTSLEVRLAWYFLALYPLITILVGATVYLATHNVALTLP